MTADSTRAVLIAIARELGLDVGTLRSRDRTSRVVEARGVAALLLRERCGASYRVVGRELGRHHTTTIRAVAKAGRHEHTRALAEFVGSQLKHETRTHGVRRVADVVDVELALRRARTDSANAPRTERR